MVGGGWRGRAGWEAVEWLLPGDHSGQPIFALPMLLVAVLGEAQLQALWTWELGSTPLPDQKLSICAQLVGRLWPGENIEGRVRAGEASRRDAG